MLHTRHIRWMLENISARDRQNAIRNEKVHCFRFCLVPHMWRTMYVALRQHLIRKWLKLHPHGPQPAEQLLTQNRIVHHYLLQKEKEREREPTTAASTNDNKIRNRVLKGFSSLCFCQQSPNSTRTLQSNLSGKLNTRMNICFSATLCLRRIKTSYNRV